MSEDAQVFYLIVCPACNWARVRKDPPVRPPRCRDCGMKDPLAWECYTFVGLAPVENKPDENGTGGRSCLAVPETESES